MYCTTHKNTNCTSAKVPYVRLVITIVNVFLKNGVNFPQTLDGSIGEIKRNLKCFQSGQNASEIVAEK